MPHIKTELTLTASPAQVWAVISDIEGWSSWTSIMTEGRGSPREGERISFRISIPGLPSLKIDARITVASPERGLVWRGGVPGVVTGEHAIEIAKASGGTRVYHHERFGGLLAFPTIAPVAGKIARAYRTLNEDLKRRVESSAHP